MKIPRCSLEERYKKALDEAGQKLASLDVARGRRINVKGLSGWVFEQTVRTCLEEDLNESGIIIAISEQVSIGGRASVDLLIGSVAVEIKAAGFFDNEGERYSGYRKKVEAKGWHYLYLTLKETNRRYVGDARESFGEDKAFFLDQEDSWGRFVSAVISLQENG